MTAQRRLARIGRRQGLSMAASRMPDIARHRAQPRGREHLGKQRENLGIRTDRIVALEQLVADLKVLRGGGRSLRAGFGNTSPI